MKILVTGGSGFLGTRLIPKLIAEGHDVFALARSEGTAEKVRGLGATPVLGDLDAPQKLSLPAIDAVAHTAAHFRFAGPRAPYFRINVDGTAALLKAAEQAGAKTFIYVSAGAVIMDDRGTPIRGADESAHTYPNSFSGYIASKARGEALVLAASKPGFRALALRPPAIWGPGDAISREIPRAVKSGQFAFINRGEYPISTCHVDNVIEAIGCALTRGQGGRAYFINDAERISFRGLIDALAAKQGLSTAGVRSIPYGVAFALGRLMEIGAALTFAKDDPPLSRTMVRLIGREFTTSDAAARRDLGYVGNVTRSAGMAMY
ncbi:MAG TPA: NAD-dependent epimerase/dehydratase family protein [Rhizomicrobium sp.]|jgi:nucleoside-diphosphate-sugar epimerase|nr:NAD-dependent epimerase/dehydratase family protein [Rhizomicrobium sp.]